MIPSLLRVVLLSRKGNDYVDPGRGVGTTRADGKHCVTARSGATDRGTATPATKGLGRKLRRAAPVTMG